MKRSNRLILLIGILLAAAAFAGVLYLLNQEGPAGSEGTPGEPTELPTVFAARDIPLGTKITEDMVTLVENFDVNRRDAAAISDPSIILGEITRKEIVEGAQITAADFAVDTSPGPENIVVPPGMVAVAVQVDQITGVGTLLRTGDYVDVVVALTGDQFPVISIDPEDASVTVVTGLNNTSVKLLLEGLQVIGTLLPPAAAPAEGQADPGTALTGQQEIVILAVTQQQSEVIKYTRLGANLSLFLRSPEDFKDPDTGEPIVPPPAGTSGVILKTLVDEYGVLVPELIEAILPAVSPNPTPGG